MIHAHTHKTVCFAMRMTHKCRTPKDDAGSKNALVKFLRYKLHLKLRGLIRILLILCITII
jgi:hypothetical protein